MSRFEVASVMDQIIEILNRHGYDDKARWLASSAAVLTGADSTEEMVAQTYSDLRGVVLGMGGLMDLRLDAPTPGEAIAARATLDELVERLYELTG